MCPRHRDRKVVATNSFLLGAYVLAESMAAARRREFSIRRALGATRARLSALVLAETVRLVGLGLLLELGQQCLGVIDA